MRAGNGLVSWALQRAVRYRYLSLLLAVLGYGLFVYGLWRWLTDVQREFGLRWPGSGRTPHG